MALDLSAYTSIQTNLFVRIDVAGYQVLRFSDFSIPYTINSESYTALGQLLSITDSSSELRATPQNITIQISGIPSNNISDFLDSSHKVKGSPIKIYRAFFNPTTGQLLGVSGNPAQKFQGVISNFDVSDDLSMGSQTGTVAITLTATNIVEILNSKLTGRKTNPVDMKQFYPTDISMDHILALTNSNFNFGAAA
jgi:hypothetical protein